MQSKGMTILAHTMFTAADLPARDSSGEYELGHGVTIEWLDNGRMVVFRLSQASRDAIDRYMVAKLALIRNWNPREPLAFISDGSHPDLAMTPYMRAKLPEIGAALRIYGIKSYAAVVIRKGVVGSLIRTFANRFYRKAGDMELAYFSTCADALDWLREKLDSAADI